MDTTRFESKDFVYVTLNQPVEMHQRNALGLSDESESLHSEGASRSYRDLIADVATTSISFAPFPAPSASCSAPSGVMAPPSRWRKWSGLSLMGLARDDRTRYKRNLVFFARITYCFCCIIYLDFFSSKHFASGFRSIRAHGIDVVSMERAKRARGLAASELTIDRNCASIVASPP